MEARRRLTGQPGGRGQQGRRPTSARGLRRGEGRRQDGQVRPANAKPSAGWVGEFPRHDLGRLGAGHRGRPARALSPPRRATAHPSHARTLPVAVDRPEVSADNGVTWTESRPLRVQELCQFDPIIEVVPNTGDVYSLFMIGFNVWFMKSIDHGCTGPIPSDVRQCRLERQADHRREGDDGQNVYAAFNGPTAAIRGSPSRTTPASGARPRSSIRASTCCLRWRRRLRRHGLLLGERCDLRTPGRPPASRTDRPPRIHLGATAAETWEDKLVATVQPGSSACCIARGDFYVGHPRFIGRCCRQDRPAVRRSENERWPADVEARRSSDKERPGSALCLSKSGEESTAPAIGSGAAGDVAPGITRPRAAATSTPGTSGTADRPTAGRAGRRP